MTRVDKIIMHLKAKGAHYIDDAGDRIVWNGTFVPRRTGEA